MSYKLISVKGNRTVNGDIEDAIAAAKRMERDLQPSFGVTVCDEFEEVVAEVRDGNVDRCDVLADEEGECTA